MNIRRRKVVERASRVAVAVVPAVGPRAANVRTICNVGSYTSVNSTQGRRSRVGDVDVSEALDNGSRSQSTYCSESAEIAGR